jgi:hypothetical protein
LGERQPVRIIISLGNSPSDPANRHDSNILVLQISCQAFFIHLPLQEDRAASCSNDGSRFSRFPYAVSGQLTTPSPSNGVKIKPRNSIG